MHRLSQFLRFLYKYRLFAWVIFGLAICLSLALTNQKVLLNWALSTVSIITLIPLAIDMINNVRAGKYAIDILAVTAVIFAIILAQYWTALAVVIVLVLRKPIASTANVFINRRQNRLSKLTPGSVNVLKKHQLTMTKISQVNINDKLVIKPGEVIALDSVIIEGEANFDDSSSTGIKNKQPKHVGDQILSGWLDIDGTITVKVLRLANESQNHQMITLLNSAAEHQTPFGLKADHYSLIFIAVAYAIGVGAWAISRQPIRFLDVMVVATPSPFLLAPIVTYLNGLNLMFRQGFFVKSGRTFEEFSETQVVAFRKEDTIIEATSKLDKVIAFVPFDEKDVLTYTASLARQSDQPIAKSIIEAAKSLKSLKIKRVHVIAGLGREARVNNKEVLIGPLRLMQEKNIKIPPQSGLDKIKQPIICLAINGNLVGYLTFTDNVKSDVRQTLKSLALLGVKRALLMTSDSNAAAVSLANRLGITDIRAEASPSDELHAIEALDDRPVTFVSSKSDDTSILTAANVGLSFNGLDQTPASRAANIIIARGNNLNYVAQSMSIAKRTLRIARQGLALGIVASTILMLIFSTGIVPSLTGTLLREAIDVIIVGNSWRAYFYKKTA